MGRKFDSSTRDQFWADGIIGNTVPLQGTVGGSIPPRSTKMCRINSVVECFVANENVIGSNPISCSKVCLVNSVVECLFYTEKVGSSNLSRGTNFYPIGEMNITQCYERWVGSLILSLGAKLWKMMQLCWYGD